MGANHMAEQLRGWSPGRAVLSPDPGGLNRALGRAAAEHLREVAPHLAPSLSCQAGLCAEHGPTVTATTTGERDGILSEPRLLLAVPMPPVPPQPEPAKADAPRKGSKAWAIQEACRIVGIAFHGIAEYDEASDCFCSESPHQDYRNDGKALAFVEAAVKEKLARENAPAPPAEAPPERDALGRLCVDGLPHSWATDPSGARFCGVCQHPPAEAAGEMSPPHGIRCDSCLTGAPHERDRHCYSVAQLLEHITSLRSSREAERQSAERWAKAADASTRERDEHARVRYEQRDMLVRQADRFAAVELERDEAREVAEWTSGKWCQCGEKTERHTRGECPGEAAAVKRENAALRAGAQRLVEAGDAIVEYVAPHGLGRKLRSDWAAAKAALDAPAGSEARR